MKIIWAFILPLSIAASALAQDMAVTGEMRRVDSWITITPPARANTVEHALFSYAANYSKLEWRVFLEEGRVLGEEKGSRLPSRLENSPEFDAEAGEFKGPYATHPVKDGWLIVYNYGEFGASLYWFNLDGTKHYKISDHQVVDFVAIGNQVYAIEGLAHLWSSKGSLIRISPDAKTGRWTTSTSVTFPSAPYAVVRGEKDTLYVVLSDGLVAVKDAERLVTLMPEAEWGSLYPNSAVLSSDESNLYIGMRQFVGVYEFSSDSFKLLIPAENMLNRLSGDVKKRIRNNYGG